MEEKAGGGVVQASLRVTLTGSMAVHAILVTLLAFEVARQSPAVPVEVAAVDVAILPAVPVADVATKPAPPPLLATPAPATAAAPILPPAPQAVPSERRAVVASTYFAAETLALARNAETRTILATLADDERLIQLCNIEAMEQLNRWKPGFGADHVVAAAFSPPAVTSSELKAKGAAVHAGEAWRHLDYRCSADVAQSRVTGFAFTLGEDIPRASWEEHALPELVAGDPTD